jgi:hypothetical protein
LYGFDPLPALKCCILPRLSALEHDETEEF